PVSSVLARSDRSHGGFPPFVARGVCPGFDCVSNNLNRVLDHPGQFGCKTLRAPNRARRVVMPCHSDVCACGERTTDSAGINCSVENQGRERVVRSAAVAGSFRKGLVAIIPAGWSAKDARLERNAQNSLRPRTTRSFLAPAEVSIMPTD